MLYNAAQVLQALDRPDDAIFSCRHVVATLSNATQSHVIADAALLAAHILSSSQRYGNMNSVFVIM